MATTGFRRVASTFKPDRVVTLFLDRPLTICLPFRDVGQLRQQLGRVPELKSLQAGFGPAAFVFVSDLAASLDAESEVELAKVANRSVRAPDFRSLVSFLAGAQFHVVLPDEADGAPDSLVGWCERFHVNHFMTATALVQALTTRGPLALTGPYAAAYAVHKSLWLNVMGNQYAFTEPIDWSIVKKLPRKFLAFLQRTKVDAHPIAMLSGPFNRIERQRAVGRLYQQFLQGDSVVNIGYDVRGAGYSLASIARSPAFAELATAYLELPADELIVEATIDTLVAVERRPTPGGYDDALEFHRDINAYKFLKIFVYLTDCEEGDGHPKVYLRSHRHFPRALIPIRRYHASEIERAIPQAKLKKVIGKAGFAFGENTLAFHRGTRPVRNHRVIFNLTYTEARFKDYYSNAFALSP